MERTNVFMLLLMLFRFGQCAKILGFFVTPSFSHQQTFQTICKELALRGHDVTFISPNILNDTSIKNLKEIDIHQTYDIFKTYKVGRTLSKDISTFERILGYLILCRVPAEIAFEDEKVRKLINSDEKFDLLIIQGFHPLLFVMETKFKVPVIGK